MQHHTQITDRERTELSALIRGGLMQKEVAQIIGKHPSAISKEIKRNKDGNGKYHAGKAKIKVAQRRKTANKRFKKIKGKLRRHVVSKLKLYWSPEQIAGRLCREQGKALLCHETIYQFIYEDRPDLIKYLRCQRGKYKRRYGTRKREKERDAMKKRRIDSRPKIIEKRKRIGDWEGDTLGSKPGMKPSILTHVDRKSGLLLADRIENKTAEHVREITVKRFNSIPRGKRKTCTYDNGSEFSEFELIERYAKITIYHAYPYHSWERGTNENTNGLLRQFFPKKANFNLVTQNEVDKASQLINNRPRKRLAYSSPFEVFKCDSN